MMGKRRVMKEALFTASASSGMSRIPGATRDFDVPWASDNRRDWLGLASHAATPAVERKAPLTKGP
jgi:hypothetical protein